jgi:outer membrane protein OmpA-like peptidoglycan-associated protein
MPPGWYYLPTRSYSTYGFYNPGRVVVYPGAARRDLVTTIRTDVAYSPPEAPPETITELPPPPPRPLPGEGVPITEVTTTQQVTEVLTRERSAENRYAGPVLVTQSVHFDYDSYAIKPDSFNALDAIGESLLKPPLDTAILNIEGHTDSDGSDDYNQDLSEKRAWSVKSYLVQKFGIDPNRLVIVGFGEHSPIAANSTDQGKAMNRRVEFENVTDLYEVEQQTAEAASSTTPRSY